MPRRARSCATLTCPSAVPTTSPPTNHAEALIAILPSLDADQCTNRRPRFFAIRAHLARELRRQPLHERRMKRGPRAHALEPALDARQAAIQPQLLHCERGE